MVFQKVYSFFLEKITELEDVSGSYIYRHLMYPFMETHPLDVVSWVLGWVMLTCATHAHISTHLPMLRLTHLGHHPNSSNRE